MSERATRKGLSKKLRFEVFKRDSFTCQYCGAKAPNVLLACDHIKPVAKGGGDDILNLRTACQPCNAGKGARELSDQAALEQQSAQLEELQERREQLDMMMQWRDELQNLNEDTISMISARILERGGFQPNETGRAKIKRWLKKYSVPELLHAIDESFDTYLQYHDDKPTELSWEKAFGKIAGVADTVRQEVDKPYLRRLLYIQGIIRNRAKMPRCQRMDYLEHVHLCGMSLDELERRAKKMSDLDDFEKPIDAWLSEIGKPF